MPAANPHTPDGDRPPIALIAAVADNGIIGVNGEMPWHIPADLKRFKHVTMGQPVIMGRKTYESIVAQIDGPLPGRTNIVLSRSRPDLPEDVHLAETLTEALQHATAVCAADEAADRIFVVGGATVYEQFLPQADQLVLTEVHETYEGDTHFPDWNRSDWVERSREEHNRFSFVEYDRR